MWQRHGFNLWCIRMRRTVSGDMVETTPAAMSCRARSAQNQWERETPFSSGRSQANLTTWTATSGGKDGSATGSWLIPQTLNPIPMETPGPFINQATGHSHGQGCCGNRFPRSQQQENSASFDQPRRNFRRTLPQFQGFPLVFCKTDMQTRFLGHNRFLRLMLLLLSLSEKSIKSFTCLFTYLWGTVLSAPLIRKPLVRHEKAWHIWSGTSPDVERVSHPPLPSVAPLAER